LLSGKRWAALLLQGGLNVFHILIFVVSIQILSQDRWGRRLFCFRKRRHGCRSARIGTWMCRWAAKEAEKRLL